MQLRIRCAVCDKPVDEWLIWRCDADYADTIVARCHGEEDRMRMPVEWLASLSSWERAELAASEGVAFQTKRIAAPETKNPAPADAGRG